MRRGRAIFWSISGAVIAAGLGYYGWLLHDTGPALRVAADPAIARLEAERRAKDDRPPEPWPSAHPWWKRVTIDAFDKATAGKSWPSARRAVVALGMDLNGGPGRTGDESEDGLAAAAVADNYRCDDPLVHLARGHFGFRSGRRDRGTGGRDEQGEAGRAMVAAADGFLARPAAYPPYIRCRALVEAADVLARAPAYLTRVPEGRRQEYADEAAELYAAVAADRELNADACLDLAGAVGDAAVALRRDRLKAVEPLLDALTKAGQPEALILAARGDVLTRYAWDARGSRVAAAVTEEGWKGFAERLKLAREALTQSWELDSKSTHAAERMVTVCMGEGADRAEVERWYKRAMEADPGNVQACGRKMLLLEPKWGGSTLDMLLFGRELTRTATDPRAVRLPTQLVEAHWTLAGYAGGSADGPAPEYFADNPDAWDDVSRVYEKYLSAVPGSRFHRTRYAVIAAWAGHWDVAAAQFAKLSDGVSKQVVSEDVVSALRRRAERKAKAGPAAAEPGGGGGRGGDGGGEKPGKRGGERLL